ncbi:DUF2199 domain-containing protein [Pseudooceanicola spongiae]|uniref:DUF2199 domain-containing protein n=1 Tax=Pseudooceanicola spongiae TaxID=2613965 RepID=A0A7L9WL87_9RHOB|nr:DUF2199 domain-containing protein [Pseudooceanicola spongiae]QOL80604.1 DUF2199 domain-containing protein [Pseudooceanicola spongiae]
MNLLSLDARWRRLNDPDFVSQIDGRSFSGLIDLGFDAPDAWPFGPLLEGGADVLEAGEDRLSPELCRLGEDRFLHAVLPIPVRGSDEVFFFAPWVQVAPTDFYAYIDSLTEGGPAFEGCEGLIANALPGFEDDDAIACRLVPGGTGERPVAQIQTDPLAQTQTDGISFDDLLDLYAAAGDDIRPHLANG